MTLCPIAIVAGCKKCPASNVCPAKSTPGDYKPEEETAGKRGQPPRQAGRWYRKRFGIESSYRCAGQVRGWTTSPNPAYRFVLLTLSFVLLKVWVHLRWLYAQVPRRGRALAQDETISSVPHG